MASSSFSPTQEKYHVFLSFRGEDTRNGFTSHLNASLCQKKIKTFIDDELRRGDEISPTLLKAIEGSQISIVIFSKDYASSRWCLKELVKIMDCRKMHGQIVIPVFYHVNPSDVRKQTGTYRDAFAEHEVRYPQREEMLQRWRSALTDAANLSGFDSNVVRPESKLIEKIVEDILKRLNIMSSSYNKNLVGIAMKIQEIKILLSYGPKEVYKVGIWGMGGIGKTTLANAVFNEISSQFEGSYFIQNIREESEKRGLIQLQEKILSTILGGQGHNIRSISTIERLRMKKVLFVFDDVTHLNQIDELIGDLENLGSGSQIIITTRDKQVLVSCRVDNTDIYEVKGLYSDESFRLFSQHAFKQNHHINEEYMVLSNRVISYSKGVPLALKVLGCFLLDRGRHEWESTLEKLKNCPHQDIQSVLKISYDGLDDEEKNLFLDVACFFNGWDEHLIRKFSSSIGLRVLIDKALITISWETIRVHDLLQEMGMEIVRQESVNRPGQRSRLWRDNDVYDVLKNNKGTDNIQGLRFDISKMRKIHLNPCAFSEMDYLRFLMVNCTDNNNNVHGFEGLEFDFAELRCLYWDSYPFTSLPLKLYPQNLVVLKMRKNNLEQLWFGIKDLANIKYIDMSYSTRLLKVPDLSEAQNLECLILEGCTSLFEITHLSRNLDKLVNLNLRNCKSLISLPIGIQSKSLRDVVLSGCSSLNAAPRISCNMERLCLDGTAINALSSSIESPSRLVQLNLQGCSRLESLPSSVCNLNSLRQLNLSGFTNLKFVLGIPRNIEELYLDGTAIKELSSSIGNASSLVRLSLRDCSSLESLPDSICRLKSLKYLCISGCLKLDRLPEDIGNLESLQVLQATGNSEDCLRLESLPSSFCKLNSLRQLNFSGFSKLKFVLGIPPNIKELYLDKTAIKELSSSIENASSLARLSLKDCSSLESLQDGICRLKSLKYLCISGCSKLPSLPKLPCNMQELKAYGCKLLKILSGLKIPSDGFSNKTLSFSDCFNLDWNAVRKFVEDALLKYYSDRILWFEKKTYFSKPGCICFPGSEMPEWFDIQSNGSCIELPYGSFNHKFLGFVVCAIVGIQDYVSFALDGRTIVGYELHVNFQNSIRLFDNELILAEDCIKSDHVFVGYYFSTSEFRECNCNTEAVINFYSVNCLIKKCGVHLLFSQEFEEAMKRSRCSIIDEEEAHSKRLKSSNFFEGESSSRENFETGQSKVMSEVEEQVVSNNNVNNGCNKVDGVGVGGVVQQSDAGGGGVGNEGRMRDGRGNGHNVVVGNAGGYGRGNWGRGNMQGMGNRGLSSPMWNRGFGAVGRGGAMGKGGNGFGQGIGEAHPLMYPQSIGFDPRFGATMGWMGSYGGFLDAPTPPFSTVLSRCSIIDEEEAHTNKRLKSSNFFKASSRENFELGQSRVMTEVEELVMSNNNVNIGYNKVDGVARGSIVQQSPAAGGGVGNESRMRHERGNGHNIVVGNAGGCGRGNIQGMGNRELSGPMWNRGPSAVGGRGLIGNGGNGIEQGISGGDPPLMHAHSIGFGRGFGAPMGRMGSYGGFLGGPSPPFSGESSSSTQLDVKSSGVHLVLPHVEEGEEFNPSTKESNSFTFLDLDKFPQDFVRSHPFTPLDSDEVPQGFVRSPISCTFVL